MKKQKPKSRGFQYIEHNVLSRTPSRLALEKSIPSAVSYILLGVSELRDLPHHIAVADPITLESLVVGHPRHHTQEEETRHEIAQRDWHLVVHQELGNSAIATNLHAGHNVEHVRDAVFKTQCSECKDGEPDS